MTVSFSVIFALIVFVLFFVATIKNPKSWNLYLSLAVFFIFSSFVYGWQFITYDSKWVAKDLSFRLYGNYYEVDTIEKHYGGAFVSSHHRFIILPQAFFKHAFGVYDINSSIVKKISSNETFRALSNVTHHKVQLLNFGSKRHEFALIENTHGKRYLVSLSDYKAMKTRMKLEL